MLAASGLAVVLVAAGCSDYDKEYSISVDDRRGAGDTLEGVVVEGKGFSPNSNVLVTFVLSATGGNTRPYIEETVQADAEGTFRLERQPIPCPQPPDYRAGSWTLVVARDEASGISGSQAIEPGDQPDCTGSAG